MKRFQCWVNFYYWQYFSLFARILEIFSCHIVYQYFTSAPAPAPAPAPSPALMPLRSANTNHGSVTTIPAAFRHHPAGIHPPHPVDNQLPLETKGPCSPVEDQWPTQLSWAATLPVIATAQPADSDLVCLHTNPVFYL